MNDCKNYRMRIAITPDAIYNQLSPEDKERFSHIEIVNATVEGNGRGNKLVEIECLALEDGVEDPEFRTLVNSLNDGLYIGVLD